MSQSVHFIFDQALSHWLNNIIGKNQFLKFESDTIIYFDCDMVTTFKNVYKGSVVHTYVLKIRFEEQRSYFSTDSD